MDKDKVIMADGFLVMCGIGIGLTFGPLVIHAQFSQPDDRIAIVVALNLFVSSPKPISNIIVYVDVPLCMCSSGYLAGPLGSRNAGQC